MFAWLFAGLVGLVALIARRKPVPASSVGHATPNRQAPTFMVAGDLSAFQKPTPESERVKMPTTPHPNDFTYHADNDSSLETDIEEALNRELGTSVYTLSSPLPGVEDSIWRDFVRWARKAKMGTISPLYTLGFYLISPKQLQDFGYMNNVRKMMYNGKEVYNGEWQEPYSKEAFLTSPALQYEAFLRILMHRVNQIQFRYAGVIGKPLAGGTGEIVSLSGLLAVSMQAGMSGLDKWLHSVPAKRFERTSEAFDAMNGRF